jgi:hypothetical protein
MPLSCGLLRISLQGNNLHPDRLPIIPQRPIIWEESQRTRNFHERNTEQRLGSSRHPSPGPAERHEGKPAIGTEFLTLVSNPGSLHRLSALPMPHIIRTGKKENVGPLIPREIQDQFSSRPNRMCRGRPSLPIVYRHHSEPNLSDQRGSVKSHPDRVIFRNGIRRRNLLTEVSCRFRYPNLFSFRQRGGRG